MNTCSPVINLRVPPIIELTHFPPLQLHDLWSSLQNPKALLTLPRTTTLNDEALPTSKPSSPSQVQSSLSLSFIFSPCSLWTAVQPDPFYPYLDAPLIDTSYAIRAFSKGWDFASFDYRTVKEVGCLEMGDRQSLP